MNAWEFHAEVAGNLREARQSAGMTQTLLAQTIGVSSGCISQYETAKRMPNLLAMSIMCHVLGVSISDLVPDMAPQDINNDPGQTSIYDVLGDES